MSERDQTRITEPPQGFVAGALLGPPFLSPYELLGKKGGRLGGGGGSRGGGGRENSERERL